MTITTQFLDYTSDCNMTTRHIYNWDLFFQMVHCIVKIEYGDYGQYYCKRVILSSKINSLFLVGAVQKIWHLWLNRDGNGSDFGSLVVELEDWLVHTNVSSISGNPIAKTPSQTTPLIPHNMYLFISSRLLQFFVIPSAPLISIQTHCQPPSLWYKPTISTTTTTHNQSTYFLRTPTIHFTTPTLPHPPNLSHLEMDFPLDDQLEWTLIANELFNPFPLWCRIHIILGWAQLFAAANGNPDKQCLAVSELIGGITTLNFHHYLAMDREKFLALVHLPFSPRLTHLDLSQSKIGEYPTLSQSLSHPIFQHLITFDLSGSKLKSIDHLFTSTNNFPNLHTLNLSDNSGLGVTAPITINPNKFPQLKVLNLSQCDNSLIDAFFPSPQPLSSQPPPLSIVSDDSGVNTSTNDNTPNIAPTPFQQPLFRLETLSLKPQRPNPPPPPLPLTALISPSLSQLKKLTVNNYFIGPGDIKALFGPETGVLKTITHLDLTSCLFHHEAFHALAQSPYLSNLTSLHLNLGSCVSGLEALIQSPYLWSSTLQHLSLGLAASSLDIQRSHLASLLTRLKTANVKLETFEPGSFAVPNLLLLNLISTSSCLSQLKSVSLKTCGSEEQGSSPDHPHPEDWVPVLERFAQSPNLSNLTTLVIPRLNNHLWSTQALESLLTSPTMSNDLIHLDLTSCTKKVVTDDFMQSIITARVVPGDETTPLKYGKLRELVIMDSKVSHRTMTLIAQNLPQLTHLEMSLCQEINDEAITALIGDEHHDPRYPTPVLSNLRSLRLFFCRITSKSFEQLAKSQLLDQLESLDLGLNVGGISTQGAQVMFRVPLYSQMKSLRIWSFVDRNAGGLSLSHLRNCGLF